MTTRIALRVSPGAKSTEFVGRHGAAWKMRVTAPPEDGRANDAAVGLLADTLGVPRASLSLIVGAAARDKVVEVRGLAPDEAERRLARAGRGGAA